MSMNSRPRNRTRRSTSLDLLRSATWAERFLWLTLLVIPFQQAFTVPVGFPLKPVEIVGALAVVAFLIERRHELFQWRGPIWGNARSRVVLLLGATVVISSIAALFRTTPQIDPAAYPQGVLADLLMYTGYAGFALALYLVASATACWALLIHALRWAVRLAAAYCVVQLLLWSADVDWLSYINGQLQVGKLYGISLPRNGPFLEGNYFGFFIVVSLFIVARSRDVLGVILALVMLGYSQSTTAVVALIAGVIVMIILRPTWRSAITLLSVAALAAIATIVIPPINRAVVAQMTKLGLIENNLGESFGYSLRTRTVNAETAFSIAQDYPLLGVGQGRYGLYYWGHLDRSGLPSNFGEQATRPIANNAYAQIVAETGFVALCALVALLVLTVIKVRADGQLAIGAVVAGAVCLVAFPAWTNLMPWVFLALIARAPGSAKDLAGDRVLRLE